MISLFAAALLGATQPAPGPAVPVAATACAIPPQPGRPYLVPTNPLEKHLLAFACAPSPETEAALVAVLMESVVFVDVDPDSVDPQTGHPKPGASMNVWSVTLPNGSKALAVFSSKEAMTYAFKDGKEHRFLAYSGADALAIAKGDPVALNWGYDPHVVLPPALVARLLGGRAPKASQ